MRGARPTYATVAPFSARIPEVMPGKAGSGCEEPEADRRLGAYDERDEGFDTFLSIVQHPDNFR